MAWHAVVALISKILSGVSAVKSLSGDDETEQEGMAIGESVQPRDRRVWNDNTKSYETMGTIGESVPAGQQRTWNQGTQSYSNAPASTPTIGQTGQGLQNVQNIGGILNTLKGLGGGNERQPYQMQIRRRRR